MNRRQSKSVNLLLTGVILTLGVLVASFFVFGRLNTAQNHIESYAERQVDELSSVIDADWGEQIARKEFATIQTGISNMLASGEYRSIVLLDEQNRVQAASRLDWAQQPVLMLMSDFSEKDAALARKGQRRVIRPLLDRSIIQAYLPIKPHDTQSLMRQQTTSLLLIEYDLTYAKRDMRQDAVRHIALFLALLMLLLGITWMLLDQSIRQPLLQLRMAARRMAGGDLHARSKLDLPNELGDLSRTLDDMAARLASDRQALLSQQNALSESERKYKALFNDSRDGIALLSTDGKYIDANPQYLSMLGYTREELLHLSYEDCTPKRWHAIETQILENQLFKRGYTDEYEKEYVDKNGRVFPVSIKASLLYGEYGEVLGMWGTARDISERKQAESKLLLAARVFENSGEGIVIVDGTRTVVSINAAFSRITGYELTEVYGQPLQFHAAGVNDDGFLQTLWQAAESGGYWEGEIRYRHRDGNNRTVWLTLRQVKEANGHVANYIGHLTDISERRAWEEHFRYLSEHDYLTGLPNRTLFQDRLQQAILQSKRSGEKLAVAFMDLDRFKNINDSLGHHIGDKLLHAVAERLKQCVRSSDTISRQGGDEFILLLTGLHRREDAIQIIEHIQAAVANVYLIDDYEFNVTSSVGLSLFPDDGNDHDALIKNADAAMYQAKAAGRNSYHVFTDELKEKAVERVQIESGLRRALENGELRLNYQPQIDIASGRIIGAETLIRWHHPELGVISPLRFIPVAEESGLIVPIGEWILQQACKQARQWQVDGFELTIAVNISAVQFRHKSLEDTVNRALAYSNLPPQWLELELTEGLIMEGSDAIIGIMQRLRQIGVKLSIDDFGTGYSSLSYLKRFPIDKLKIDQSFVRDITSDPDDAAITRAIINMAQSLKLKVIAEGVENEAQLDYLRQHACDEYQGYYCSKPLPADEFSTLLQSMTTRRPAANAPENEPPPS
ncbi:MAG: EAL domain-containing protein [Neisseriaceae bacterium]|nr:MAG: EAL domain-containing protein [Neisseriaceae bacterium]